MNCCKANTCTVKIMAEQLFCRKHRRPGKKEKRQTILNHEGKVNPGMGLARLKELDRQKWLAREAARQQENEYDTRSAGDLDKI